MFSRIFSTGELCAITDVSSIQIDIWCRNGLLHPLQPRPGPGQQRRFDGDEAILVPVLRDLTDAGLSVPMLIQAVTVLRDKLARTPPAWRSAELFATYVETVRMLAQTFGKTEAYDRWLMAATACLTRMRRAAKVREKRPPTSDDAAEAEYVHALLVAVSQLPDSGLTVRRRHE